ncbi:MAG: DUF1844 domain-containing protein [Pyrinomonadaceae bacterium]
MNEEQTSFKVTDRRLFNADGTPRDLPPEVAAQPKVEPSAEPSSAPTVTPEAQPSAPSTSPEPPTSEAREPQGQEEDELPDADNPAGFANFIMSIASNAASSLGMMEHPVTHKREVDLELAKHWIDILGMLQQKTRGNLAVQEEKILESLLADLRMQFVSLTNAASPKTSRAYTGRDIIGG